MDDPQIKEVIVRLKAKPDLSGGSVFHHGSKTPVITIGKHENGRLGTDRDEYWFEVNIRFYAHGKRHILALIPTENIENIEITLED